MGYLRLGRYNPELQVIDVGPIDFKQALQELENCFTASALNYPDAAARLSATTFFLSRTKADFLDISHSGNSTISILSDLICSNRRSVWSALFFRTKSTFSMEVDKATAQKILGDYFKLSREDFELIYQRDLKH